VICHSICAFEYRQFPAYPYGVETFACALGNSAREAASDERSTLARHVPVCPAIPGWAGQNRAKRDPSSTQSLPRPALLKLLTLARPNPSAHRKTANFKRAHRKLPRLSGPPFHLLSDSPARPFARRPTAPDIGSDRTFAAYPPSADPKSSPFARYNQRMLKDLKPLFHYMARYRWGYLWGTLALMATNAIWVLFPKVFYFGL